MDRDKDRWFRLIDRNRAEKERDRERKRERSNF